MMKPRTDWLAFNIRFPDELIPTYNFLQSELNAILNDTECRQQLETIDLNQLKGNVWRQMNTLFGSRIKVWPIKNKAWYGRILFENLRRELNSKRDRTIIWNEYINNSKIINSKLMNNLHKLKLYPTKGNLRNIARADKKPIITNQATLNLDYSISDKQMFTMDEFNYCKIQLMNGVWLDYQILLPSSLNHNLTGRIAKPRFIKRKSDGKYIGVCSYEYIPEKSTDRNILGVDFGKIKYFSTVATNKKGEYSDEFVQSKRTTKLLNELSKLYKEKAKLRDKIQRTNSYKSLIHTNKQNRRDLNYLSITHKVSRMKKTTAKQTADEIVQVAINLKCKEIHVENLSWLESTGGKWDFSEIQNRLKNKAKQHGIKLVKVSAFNSSKNNPVTHEVGTVHNRIIRFSNGEEIDRDLLAAINLSIRTKKSNTRTIPKLRKHHGTAKHAKFQSRRKKIKNFVNKIKRNIQIVVFQPYQVSQNRDTLWCPIFKDIPNCSLLSNNYQNYVYDNK